ncbi:MAG: hypothetical protein HY825_19600 [Acidobacteria bacterium]|nr:hypothetical protein [Acidobacteriota bacterium]
MSPDLENLLQYLDKRFDAMEQRFVHLERRFDELKTRFADLQASVDAYAEHLGVELEY